MLFAWSKEAKSRTEMVNIAALRCYLTVVYGNFLDVPEALLADQINYRNLWSTSARCGE